jgi:hypothetical protein
LLGPSPRRLWALLFSATSWSRWRTWAKTAPLSCVLPYLLGRALSAVPLAVSHPISWAPDYPSGRVARHPKAPGKPARRPASTRAAPRGILERGAAQGYGTLPQANTPLGVGTASCPPQRARVFARGLSTSSAGQWSADASSSRSPKCVSPAPGDPATPCQLCGVTLGAIAGIPCAQNAG